MVEHSPELVAVYRALARAERVLDDQKKRPPTGTSFSDYLPYVVDRAGVLWRELHQAARRRQADSNWRSWVRTTLGEDSDIVAVRNLRNAGVKYERITAFPRTEVGGAVVLSSSLSTVDDEGNVDEVRATGIEGGSQPAVWHFSYGESWDGKPVLATLEAYLARWRNEILPEAERRLWNGR